MTEPLAMTSKALSSDKPNCGGIYDVNPCNGESHEYNPLGSEDQSKLIKLSPNHSFDGKAGSRPLFALSSGILQNVKMNEKHEPFTIHKSSQGPPTISFFFSLTVS